MSTPLFVQAGEVDVLLEKLVEKGILTPMEAQIIKDETKQSVAEQIADAKHDTMPTWIQRTKLKGDIRLRYQWEERETDQHARNRGRVRLRLGVDSKINNQLKIGAGLASGDSNSATSTNVTLRNNFTSKNIYLDYAYVRYSPIKEVKLIGGKFKRKKWLWATTDMLWDGDINPEGVSLHAGTALDANTDVFLNTGFWVIDEYDTTGSGGTDTDPFLTFVQAGVKGKSGAFDGKVAGIFYDFNGIKGEALDGTRSTNTKVGSVLKHDYNVYGASVELGAKELLGGLPFKFDERLALFGDYVKNSENVTDDQDTGWAAGVKFGNKKVKNPGTWQGKYQYVHLERDAFPDAYPDGDRYGGKTDVKSHEVALSYAWKKNVIFGIDYYCNDRIKAAADKEHVFQLDALVKF